MKTIHKLQKPFFPSGIMDLGALASSKYAACGDTPQILLRRALAPAASLYLAVCRASDL